MNARVSWSNVLAVLAALYLGASCADSPCVDAQETAATPRLVFRGLEPFVPDAYARGLWYDMQSCAYDWSRGPEDVRWAVANAIVDVETRELLWGVVATIRWDGHSPEMTIVVDRTVRYSARVLSHEIIHVVADVGDTGEGSWKLGTCQLYDGPYDLPERPLTDEQLRSLMQPN